MWVNQCFFCRVALRSHEARNEPPEADENPRANRQFGYTCVFMSDAGEGGYFTEAVGKWKMVCFQCGYLFL